jgi:hypothetical protein
MSVQERITLRNVYLYLVCLITLVISIFATVSVVRNVVGLAYPDPGYYSAPQEPGSGVSAEEQARQQKVSLDSQRRQAVLGLVGSGTLLLLAGPVYLYHWRRVQSELALRTEPVEPAGAPPAD